MKEGRKLNILDLRKLEKYKNLEQYVEYMNNNSFEDFIRIVKARGILINRYGLNNDNKLKNQLSEYIYNNKTDCEIEKWDDLKKESDIVNDIRNQFNENLKNDFIKVKNPLESFLLVTEKLLRFIHNIIDDKEKTNNELGLNFDLKIEKNNFYKQNIMRFHDVLTIEINKILTSLLFFEYPKHLIDVKANIEESELENSFKHFNYVQINDLLDHAINSWKLGGRKIYVKENITTFDICGDLEENFFIVLGRYESKSNKIYIDIAEILKKYGEIYPIGENITDYLNLHEFLSCGFLAEYIGVNNDLTCYTYKVDNINYESVSIKELIRAYYVLMELSIKYINNQESICNNLYSWCMILTHQEIKSNFARYGIKDEHIDVLIKQLTYRKGIDIFDAPMINIGKDYLVLPSVLIKIDVSKLVLSIISEIKSRGNLFEEEIKTRITSQGIKCDSLYYKDNEEYQCDLAFIIENDLFICECKAWNEIKNINGYYNMLLKMQDSKIQLNRIAEKFKKKINIINEKFNYPSNHVFDNIHEIVITLNMQGIYNKIDDTYFVDKSCLLRFLEREKPALKVIGKCNEYHKYQGFEEYDGEITNEKFFCMLDNPAPIQFTRANKDIGINNIEMNERVIQIPMFVRRYETTQYYEMKGEC